MSRITSAVAFQINGFGWLFQVASHLIGGPFEFLDATESAAPNHAVGDDAEPAFDLVEPRTAGRREVE